MLNHLFKKYRKSKKGQVNVYLQIGAAKHHLVDLRA